MKSLNKLAAVLAVMGALVLAGCGGGGGGLFGSDSGGASSTPSEGIRSGGAAPGTGVIQSIQPVSQDGKTIQRFSIRMDKSGAMQTVTHATNAGFNTGDKVRIENGMMRRN
jgi:hypothetical protein